MWLSKPLRSIEETMNEILKKLLLAGNKYMLGIYLKQPGFNYFAFGPITKNKERFRE